MMKTKVWNLETAPFYKAGSYRQGSDMDSLVDILLAQEAARLARFHQLDAPKDKSSLRRFQKKLRTKIREKLGVAYDSTVPLDVTEFGTVKCEGFTIHKLMYQSRPGIYVTALLYVPDGEGTFPAVVHMHGHNEEGKFAERVQGTSLDLVRNGYVCLAVDTFGTYERAARCYDKEYHGAFQGFALMNLGETLMGCQIVDNMRGVDLLESLPYVKKNRIGATGASGGGNQTMWLAAMDERIAAAVPIVSVGSFTSYVSGSNCVCEMLPDGMTLTEEAGVLALIAPRPLRIGNALYDTNPTFAISEMLKTFRQVQKVYWNLGYPDRIAYTVANRVHGMHDEQRETVLGWFACHLKGEGAGFPIQEPDWEMMDEDGLHLFAAPEDRPAVGTIDGYNIRRGTELRDSFLKTESFSSAEKRKELAALLRFRTLPPVKTALRYEDSDGWERWALEVGDHLIPVLIRKGSDEKRWKILVKPSGKREISQSDIAEAMADGAGVAAFDLFGTGETVTEGSPMTAMQHLSRQLLWIGRTVLGEWAFDIQAVVKMLERRGKGAEVTVCGWKEAGAAAVFAAALKPNTFAVETIDTPASYLFCRDSVESFDSAGLEKWARGCHYSAALAVPGFLQWGDMSLAAALAGKVSFRNPRAYDGTPYTAEQEKTFVAETEEMRRKLN